MMMLSAMKIILAVVLGVLLSGCGEGGGDASDTTPPVLELLGDNPMVILLNHPCKDPGATATDDQDGYVPIQTTGTVDITTVGTYPIVYRATDTSGNTAEKTRIIRVVSIDTVPPVIALLGANPVTVLRGGTYTDAGATASDNFDGNLPSNIVVTNPVQTDTIGTYTVRYNVSDSAGNAAAEVQRTVHVVADSGTFRLRIKTDNPGTSGNKQFTIPTTAGGYDYSIDCEDDGTYEENNVSGDHTCNYPSEGNYTVVIKGAFPRIYFNDGGDANKTLAIEQWGTIQWSSMEHAFHGCTNIDIEATDVPDLSGVTDLSFMFCEAHNLTGGLGDWNVSNVKTLYSMLRYANNFNGEMSHWDTSQVKYMQHLFEGATTFDQNISGWDTSSVIDMNNMFSYAEEFNQTLALWDTSQVNDFSFMFDHAEVFDQNISDWNTSNAHDMQRMFRDAKAFNFPIGQWDTHGVTATEEMFRGAVNFDQSISDWNTSNVLSMHGMFHNANDFNQPIGGWDTSQVTDMSEMFRGAGNFNQPLCWDVSRVSNFGYMFKHAGSFNQDIGGWDTNAATTMSYMFYGANIFDQDIGNWDIRNVTSMNAMFGGGAGLSVANYESLLEKWDAEGPKNNVHFDGGNSQYRVGTAAATAKSDLNTTYSWTITDGGSI
jgi:surface protein